ncbi:hypothetical protein RFI_26129 [Reticulomyxa filosa]|uniref:Uncharacterized protein n=1 Tax=Reticulomyxa filosa TaxID=46433 RepID=X6MCS7_RETFI|nr:hypothetical protein RFI_26129 [Reticulomyxa filosa]|eukprot:ETO11252.1 hypothetical protein RFI_26129 [Reticulomyxa filosa]
MIRKRLEVAKPIAEYDDHYSERGTKIACKWAMASASELIGKHYKDIESLQNELQRLKRQGTTTRLGLTLEGRNQDEKEEEDKGGEQQQQQQQQKYELWMKLCILGSIRTVHLAFMSCMIHVLLHVVLCIVCRRSHFIHLQQQQQQQLHDTDCSRDIHPHLRINQLMTSQIQMLFMVVQSFHRSITNAFGQLLRHRMRYDLLEIEEKDDEDDRSKDGSGSKYTLDYTFESLYEVNSTLFQDLIDIATICITEVFQEQSRRDAKDKDKDKDRDRDKDKGKGDDNEDNSDYDNDSVDTIEEANGSNMIMIMIMII